MASRDDVPSMFNRIAGSYDLVNRILSLGLDQYWRRKVAKTFQRKEPIHLLDLATGTGDQIAAFLEQKISIERAVGIDLSEKMLEMARKKIKSDSIEFLYADALQLPFKDASFDACTFSFGIRNVLSPVTALKEMLRVTKRKGTCLILEFSLPKKPLRWPYLFYLRYGLPYIGGLVARDLSAYRYLNRTIEGFAYGERFLDWMREAGWDRVSATPMCGGIVTLYRGDNQ